MQLHRTRGIGALYLSLPSSIPPFRSDFPFDTHALFASRISTSDTTTSFFTSVSIPRHLIPPWFAHGCPLCVEGSLTVHFVGRTRLQWQLDVDRVLGEGLPALCAPAGQLAIQFSPLAGELAAESRGGFFGEAWIVDIRTSSGVSQIW